MTVLQNTMQILASEDYTTALPKINSNSSEQVGDYIINRKYGNLGDLQANGSCSSPSIDSNASHCIPVDISIKNANDNSDTTLFSLNTTKVSPKIQSFTKEEIDNMLKGYVTNDNISKAPLTLKVGEGIDEERKQIYAYSDGKEIGLYPSKDIEFLGKPDWDRVIHISFPFVAPEDGFIWIHLGHCIPNDNYDLRVVTPEGNIFDDLLRTDWGGSIFTPVNKGDTIICLHDKARLNGWRYFIPYKKQ